MSQSPTPNESFSAEGLSDTGQPVFPELIAATSHAFRPTSR